MIEWRPSANAAALRLRAGLLAQIREYFTVTGALEVETPSLSRTCVTDVHLASVSARVNGETFFLHTSPEYAMKRLLAAGTGDIWQAARVYRDGEHGRWHNPEFTLIEWYRVGMDHHALMSDVERLLNKLLAPTRELRSAERLSYGEVLREYANLDVFAATPATMIQRLLHAGIDVPAALATDRDACLDLLMSTLVGPRLGQNRLTFVYDYPASQAALARIRGSVASRFELYLDGLELANGFHELTDAKEQRARFEAGKQARKARGLPEAEIDERFLAALAHGLPDCSGVALGFDRVVMCAAKAQRIDEILSFGFEEN